MTGIIYLDVIFIENLLVNYLLIYVVDRCCRSKASAMRIALAAFIGSCCVLMVFGQLPVLMAAILKILVSILMLLAAFGCKRPRLLARQFLLFYLFSFVLCGAILAIYFLTKSDIVNVNGTLVIQNISYWHILGGAAIAKLMAKTAFDYLEGRSEKLKRTLELKLKLSERCVNVQALVDSGNLLVDPATGKKVIIVGLEAMLQLLPENYRRILVETYSSMSVRNKLDYELLYKLNSVPADTCIYAQQHSICFRLIPYRSLGVENGRLLGVVIDSIEILAKDKTSIIERPVIAIYEKMLCEDTDRIYDAIVYSGIIKGDFA